MPSVRKQRIRSRPLDRFFKEMEELGLALTYDDVRLKTGYADFMPDDTILESSFSRSVGLKIPLVSAAMDTVTEYELATALAKAGGLGIIHRGLAPEEQARHVGRVKYHLNGLIDRPICVRENETIREILHRRDEKGYSFHSFPVVNTSGRLVGLLTRSDFDFCADLDALARDVMESELLTTRRVLSVQDAFKLMRTHRKKVLPVVSRSGEIRGLYTYKDVRRLAEGSEAFHNIDARGQLRVGAAVGAGRAALERAALLVEKNVDVLVVDTAHGDSKGVVDIVKTLKKKYGDRTDVVAGNISTGEAAERLIRAGVDGVKVGQGPGSICTTRVVAGIGAPQVSAVYDVARAAAPFRVPVCADGGVRFSGDIPIALAAGASSVMLGGMFAGVREAPGDLVFFEGRQWKNYRGMGSLGAMAVSQSSRERYGQRDVASKADLVPEGVEGLVPYKGELADVLTQYVGGLRRGMGYVGSRTVPELQAKAKFIRMSGAGVAESHPHDVRITREAPNYQRGS